MRSDFEDIFSAENESGCDKDESPWSIIIADDEQSVHDVTKLALSNVCFYGKTLKFYSTYSGQETLDLLKQKTDIALIILDVVMEKEDAGLKAVMRIREELENRYVRIVLRTGYPGQAPERDIILTYDINNYLNKSDTTSQKLFTAVISALRSYCNLTQISREVSRTIINSAQVGIIVADASTYNIVEANPTAQELVGLSQEKIIGRNCNDFFHRDGLDQQEKQEAELFCNQEHTLTNIMGSKIPVLKSTVHVDLHDKKFLIGTFIDISRQKQLEEQLRYLAYFDALTSLPNRFLFNERLRQEVRHAKRYKNKMALFFLDLNDFKTVNDTSGHQVGDLLLKEVGGRLGSAVRECDFVARLGGDEFGIIVVNPRRNADIRKITKKIIDDIERPFKIDTKEFFIGVSIGISIFSEGHTEDTMLMEADMAMYQAKESTQKSAYSFFRKA